MVRLPHYGADALSFDLGACNMVRFKLVLLSLVTIVQELVFLSTFTLVSVDWRSKLLFSEWFDNE